jgi:hypothetical protein
MKKHYANFADVPASDWPWPNFQPSEIACRGTGQLLVDHRAMSMLQDLRNRLGKPIHVNSGYRSPEHNRAVKGARNSKHMEGIAFDCRMAGHDPQVFMATARAVGFNGIGEYPVLGFCHIDARAEPAHWLGSRGKAFPGSPAAPSQASPPPTAPRAPVAAPAPAQRPDGGIAGLIARFLKALRGDA